jgi:hypothetical protein
MPKPAKPERQSLEACLYHGQAFGMNGEGDAWIKLAVSADMAGVLSEMMPRLKDRTFVVTFTLATADELIK